MRPNLYNPWTTEPVKWQRQPFSYNGQLNVIDPKLISPLAKYLHSVTPAPTHPEVNPLVEPNYIAPRRNNRPQHTETARIDHRFSDRDLFFARYTHGGYSGDTEDGPNRKTPLRPLVLELIDNADVSEAESFELGRSRS